MRRAGPLDRGCRRPAGSIWLEDAGKKRGGPRDGTDSAFRGQRICPAIFGLSDRRRAGRSTCNGIGATTPAARSACGTRRARSRPSRCRGTQTAINLHGLLSFCSVSVRGEDVYRCRPEAGFGLCQALARPEGARSRLGGYPSICSPILLRRRGRVRRPGRQPVRRAAVGRRQGVVVQDGLRQADFRPGRRVRRPRLLRLRGWVSLRAGARREGRPAVGRPRAAEDSQPAFQQTRRAPSTIGSRTTAIGRTPMRTTRECGCR